MTAAATPSTTATPTRDHNLHRVDPRTLLDSPTNPRGPYSEAWDLRDLIEQGPEALELLFLLARPVEHEGEARLELVYGHRRKYAAIALGMDYVSVDVQELSDQEVLKVQWAENGAREDVHPMLEARHLELMVQQGFTQEELAADSGKTQPWVSKRISLCALSPKCQERFLAGAFSVSHALLLARIANHKTQEQAMRRLFGTPTASGEIVSVGRAREIVQREFMLDLRNAQWDLTDAKLLPSAGACSSCPKASDSQAVLFDDVSGKVNLCADPVCWRKKADAQFARVKIQAKNAGLKVIAKKEGKKLFDAHHPGLGYEGRRLYASLEDEEWVGGKRVKVRAAIKKLEKLPAVTMAQDPNDGRTVELVSVADAKRAFEALRRVSIKKDREARGDSEWARREREQKRQRKIEARTNELAAAEIVKVVEKRGLDSHVLKLLAELLVPVVWSDTAKVVAKRRGLEVGDGGVFQALAAEVPNLPPSGLCGLIVELVVGGRGNDQTERACKGLGIKLGELRKRATAELKAKGAKKRKGA